MVETDSPLVVIFDDDRDYAESLKLNLIKIDKRVQAVSSFEQFGDINFTKTKCLILDFYLAESSTKYSNTALDVLTELRHHHPSIKVILHSGQAENKNIAEADEMGIYEYIPKGDESSLPRIIKTVHQILNGDDAPSPNIPPTEQASDVKELRAVIDQLNAKIEANLDHEQSTSDIKEAYKQYIREERSILSRISSIITSGQYPGMLLDKILEDFIGCAGAQGGAWFLLTDNFEKIRDQNCQLKRTVKVHRKAIKMFGATIWEELNNQGRTTQIIPIDVADARSRERGIFEGRVILCVFAIEAYSNRLLFVLEYSGQTGDGANETRPGEYSPIDTYVTALSTMLDILPIIVTKWEFGKVDKMARFGERHVSWMQIVSRSFMSFLSFFLFVAAIFTSIFAFIFLITSVIGLPNVLEKGFVWDFGRYGVGIIHALEVFILAITLYLLGVGLSCMIDHPRLSGLPLALRYLDNPVEMKRSLILAICTLLAVAGVKFILEFEMPLHASTYDWLKALGIFGSKIIASVLLILTLTNLIGNTSSRPFSSSSAREAD